MASAQLNFNESTLDHSSVLYDLYSRLYNGMVAANQVDAPDYTTNPPLTEDGEIDQDAIASGLSSYSTILMKNSAYLYANAIISALSSGGGGSGGLGFVSRSGDSMEGLLQALYGFKAGVGGSTIFEVGKQNNKTYASIDGGLIVTEDIKASSDSSIYLGNFQALYLDDGALHVGGSLVVDGSLKLDEISIGDIKITEEGIFFDEDEYYHSGNSNKSDVDWSMRNGHVYGTLQVDGTSSFGAALSAKKGFAIGDNDVSLLYSQYNSETDDRPIIKLASDIDVLSGYGIKFQDKYIIKVRGGSDNVVSFSAPGKVLNLGDSDGTTATTRISLQADIYDASSAYRMISTTGDGNFPNSFSAGCGNAGSTVMQTYYGSATNMGVVFQKNIRLGSASGPSIYNDDGNLAAGLNYLYVDESEVQHTVQIPLWVEMVGTTSLFHDLTIENSATAKIDTEAEFFLFGKPVEAESFAIASETYKTRLIENALFLNDGIWIEGITGGMSIHGDAVFSGDLGSAEFASGFAGYGWGVRESALYGGYEATFDNLTVRKKMRIYELEVQKISATNGSLWVSDACSGDIVQEVN